MLLILYVLDSLFLATPNSKRVSMHVWRHMLLTLWFVDSLFFATPNSKLVLIGTKVGGEVHGEGQRKRKSARRRAWRVSNLFFGFYAPLAKRFSLPIRRVRGREARCYIPKLGTVLDMLLILFVTDPLFLATPKSKRVLVHAWWHWLFPCWFVDSLYFATPRSRRVCLMHSWHATYSLCHGLFVFGDAQE